MLGFQEVPRFAPLFFYDPDYATNIRAGQYPQLDHSILLQLTVMFTDCSPFIKIYETTKERLYTQSGILRILLSPQMRLVIESRADRRRENLLTGNELTVVIPNEFSKQSRRDIILAVRDSSRNRPQLERLDVTL